MVILMVIDSMCIVPGKFSLQFEPRIAMNLFKWQWKDYIHICIGRYIFDLLQYLLTEATIEPTLSYL